MKNKLILITVLTILLSGLRIFSTEESLSWNIEEFEKYVYSSNNALLVTVDGRKSYYGLKKSNYNLAGGIDLYMSFDREQNTDETLNYKITYKQLHYSTKYSMNNYGGYFYNSGDGVTLTPSRSSFFAEGFDLNSFSIGMWLYPLTVPNNEVILKLGNQFFQSKTDKVTDESIVIKYKNGNIIVEINNLFKNNDKVKEQIILKSYNKIIPEKWSFINFIYDADKGIVKLYINSVENAIATVTSDGTIYGQAYGLKFDRTNHPQIKIAPQFIGAIDEFVISRNCEVLNSDTYNLAGGEIKSIVYEISKSGSYISNVAFNDEKLNNTGILYYYRFSDKPFSSEDKYSPDVKWNIYKKENIANQKIRYIQWKILLLPGENSEFSPKFRGLKYTYEKNLAPAKPLGVKVLSGNGSVKIKWFPNPEKDVKGYKIYYGTKQNDFFGKGAKEGFSPVNAGLKTEFELTGLKNNILYYFYITCYDDNEARNESDFSDEVSSRPLE